MGQVLHGGATTTAAIRRAVQHSQESLRALASRYGVNPKTIANWKQRSSVDDRPTGPRQAKSTVLSVDDEAIIVAFRQHTLPPLDDCLYALQAILPHLTRSPLHRCLQRHDISHLPEVEAPSPPNASSRPTRSAISISTSDQGVRRASPRSTPPKESFICWSPTQ